MLGTREYTLCSPFRANAHNSSFICRYTIYLFQIIHSPATNYVVLCSDLSQIWVLFIYIILYSIYGY